MAEGCLANWWRFSIAEDLSYTGVETRLQLMQGQHEGVEYNLNKTATEMGLGFGLGAAGAPDMLGYGLSRLPLSLKKNVVSEVPKPLPSNPRGNHSLGEADDFYQVSPDGSYNWPEKLGFVDGPQPGTLAEGTILDRYGSNNGAFLSPEGIPFEQRALGPSVGNREYHRYEVLKLLPIIEGEIAPAFGKPGGGRQILPDFSDRVNVQWLIDNSYLREL